MRDGKIVERIAGRDFMGLEATPSAAGAPA